MDGHGYGRRSAAVLGGILLALGAGFAGYELGVSHGIAVSGQLAAGGGAWPYGWYRPHLFGFGPFFPLLVLFFWFAVARTLFWGGPWRWGAHRRYWEEREARFDDWHRRAHDRMTTDAAPANRS